ncbi:MAG: hypothetical protein JWM38_743 [Sphingomonas bacterium]|jgi:hypothetical protein|nr:hypothetical protein [Sphingomonas bacterium]MDB5683337.1 hypothetical protein [Sphingomonas bacterium]MDB5717316.1 hypothetical protein [Sphingomonas bacterium]
MSEPREALIRRRAYALWEADGRPAGKEDEHWRQALREIEAEDVAPQPQAEASATPKPRARKPKATAEAPTTKPPVAPVAKPRRSKAAT